MAPEPALLVSDWADKHRMLGSRDSAEPGPYRTARTPYLREVMDALGLPKELRRSLACTNIIENIMGSVRRVCRNVKRWRDASMALRWTAAAMLEAAKGFRRLKAKSQLPQLRAALLAHQQKRDPAVSVAQAQQAA